MVAQLAGAIAAFVGLILSRNAGWPAPPAALCVFWGFAAAAVSLPMGLRRWWLPVQAVAPVLVWVVLGLQPPGWLYLVAFALLLLVYWNAVGEGVPLYLSNRTTWRTLESLLPEKEGVRAADLGSGLGGTLVHLARARPDGVFTGFETAPLVYLWSRLRLAFSPVNNVTVRFQSFWRADLSEFDLVYCFLSPVPMERLFAKARSEMKPGSVFVSNSFAVPDEEPDEVVEVDDRRRTRLLVWKF